MSTPVPSRCAWYSWLYTSSVVALAAKTLHLAHELARLAFADHLLGIIALTQIKRDPAAYGGKGFAYGGIAAGSAFPRRPFDRHERPAQRPRQHLVDMMQKALGPLDDRTIAVLGLAAGALLTWVRVG